MMQMSDILIGLNPDDPNRFRTQPVQENIPFEERGKQLPKPSGFHILCAVPEIEDNYESGLVKADITMHHEEILTTVLFVISMGPDAYADKARFPSGPWCKEGDFIVVRPNSGTRLDIHGREFRIINDDTVEGTVDDPRGIRRK
jgi:co-chaperonin GroES (HSP10)